MPSLEVPNRVAMLERTLFFLLIASLPFEGLFFESPWFAISATNVLLITLFGVVFARIVLTGQAYSLRVPGAGIVLWLLFLLPLAQLISLLGSQHVEARFARPIMTDIGYLVLCFSVFEVVRTERDVERAFLLLCLAMVVFTFFTTLVVFGVLHTDIPLANPRPLLHNLLGVDVFRGSLFQISYGLVAMLASASVSYTTVRIFTCREPGKRLLLSGTLVIVTFMLLLDVQSRNVALAIACTVLSMLLLSRGKVFVALGIGGVLLVSVALYAFGAEEFFVRIFATGKDMTTVDQRFQQVNAGIGYLSTSPFWGLGSKWVFDDSVRALGNPIHNYFIGKLASTGFMGLSLLAMLWLVIMANVFLLRKRAETFGLRQWWLVFLATAVGQLVALNFFPGESIKIFYIQLALSTVLATMEANLKKHPSLDGRKP